jgi:hypothetical protein
VNGSKIPLFPFLLNDNSCISYNIALYGPLPEPDSMERLRNNFMNYDKNMVLTDSPQLNQ